jgi:uncharacterized protein YbgA (DUF1722 family)/uncharacterized protein YbbK (DUF523 family)
MSHEIASASDPEQRQRAWPNGFPRPVVVMSQCLELEACRYNGQAIRAPFVLQLEPFVEFRPVCPEVEIGLGVPRDPIRLVTIDQRLQLIQPSTKRDLTNEMQSFSNQFLSSVGDVDGFLLKSRSPSCGIKDTKTHSGGETRSPMGKGPGLFGAAALARFPRAAIEDEGRLTNLQIRHHFLTKLFARGAFRDVKRKRAMAELVHFHTANKFILLAYHQAELRALGRIVANKEKKPLDDVLADYEEHLGLALVRPARRKAHINVLMHAMGYFSDRLSADEKAFFLDALEVYREGRESLTGPLAVIQSWITRFDEDYLAGQRYFAPYPRELRDLRDSGRKGA